MQNLKLQLAGSVADAVASVCRHRMTPVSARQVKPWFVSAVIVDPRHLDEVRAWYAELYDTKVGPPVAGDLLHWALVDE